MMEMAERMALEIVAPILSTLTPEQRNKLILKQCSIECMRRFCVFPLSGCLHCLRGSVVLLLLGSRESVAHRLRGTFNPIALPLRPLHPPMPCPSTSHSWFFRPFRDVTFRTDFCAGRCKHFTSQRMPVPLAPDHTFPLNSSAPHMHLFSDNTTAVTKAWKLIKRLRSHSWDTSRCFLLLEKQVNFPPL